MHQDLCEVSRHDVEHVFQKPLTEVFSQLGALRLYGIALEDIPFPLLCMQTRAMRQKQQQNGYMLAGQNSGEGHH